MESIRIFSTVYFLWFYVVFSERLPANSVESNCRPPPGRSHLKMSRDKRRNVTVTRAFMRNGRCRESQGYSGHHQNVFILFKTISSGLCTAICTVKRKHAKRFFRVVYRDDTPERRYTHLLNGFYAGHNAFLSSANGIFQVGENHAAQIRASAANGENAIFEQK